MRVYVCPHVGAHMGPLTFRPTLVTWLFSLGQEIKLFPNQMEIVSPSLLHGRGGVEGDNRSAGRRGEEIQWFNWNIQEKSY